MLAILSSEWLKYRRTFAKRLLLLAPSFVVLFALIQKLFMPDLDRSWAQMLMTIDNQWPVILLPLLIALLASLAQGQEAKSDGWRLLRSRPVAPAALWAGKVTVLALLTLLSIGALILFTLLAGLFSARGAVPWAILLTGALLPWLVSLTLLPLELWTATRSGTGAAMILAFVGLMAGTVVASTRYWYLVPWSWPLRLLAPIVGVHPNGIPLHPGDPLLNAGVIPVGIGLSLVSFIVFTALTAGWFGQQEVR